jgi:hypothetical protein
MCDIGTTCRRLTVLHLQATGRYYIAGLVVALCLIVNLRLVATVEVEQRNF